MEKVVAVHNVEEVTISVTEEAIKAQQALLAESREWNGDIADEIEADLAVNLASRIRKLIKDARISRREMKAPVREVGKRIDVSAQDFVGPLQSRLSALERMITNWNCAVIDRAGMRAKREQQIVLERATEVALAERDGKPMPPAPEMPPMDLEQPAGTYMRGWWRIVVEDSRKVYEARPDLCMFDVSRTKVLEAINGGMRECPGLTIFWEEKTITKTAPEERVRRPVGRPWAPPREPYKSNRRPGRPFGS